MRLTPVKPFEPVSVDRLPSGGEWIAQVKWDGVRMLSYFDGKEARLINRRLNDRTLQYPEFADPTAYCSGSSFILDGEFIAFDENRPSFREIMKRDSLRRSSLIGAAVPRIPVTYMIFDVLYANGDWVTDRPLFRRQALLEEIVRPNERVQLCRNFTDADALFELMGSRRMEGVVCKDLNAAYGIGRKDDRWRKRKIARDLYAAVGGVTYNGNTVNSLLLGVYDESGGFRYIGHAGTGKLKREDWRRLTERIPPIASATMPFSGRPERYKDATWVVPRIVVRVQYMEWTAGGTMRQPSIQAIMTEDLLPSCTIGQA